MVDMDRHHFEQIPDHLFIPLHHNMQTAAATCRNDMIHLTWLSGES